LWCPREHLAFRPVAGQASLCCARPRCVTSPQEQVGFLFFMEINYYKSFTMTVFDFVPFCTIFAEFDEGAAQVKRLLSRDRKDLTNYEELESAFSALPQEQTVEEGTSSAQPLSTVRGGGSGKDDKGDSTPQSSKPGTPTSATTSFGTKLSGSAMSPFGSSSQYTPAQENLPLSTKAQEDDKWWSNISLTQIFILISFTLIIGLMISTFFFVLNVGAVRFNE
jgi:hypothetical protein